MKPRLRHALALTVTLVGLPMFAACEGRDRNDDGYVRPAEERTDADVRVTEVKLGKQVDANKRITEETGEFRPMDTIYATVVTSGTASSGTLSSRWTYEDGQVVDETRQNITTSGETVTEFHIAKPDGLPVGKYKLEVLLNGNTVETKEFEVKAK